jgi:hypothetical protein
VAAAYECTDRGGSSLETCAGTVDHGQPLDTATVGEHTYTVTATDGAGGTTTVTRRYVVGEAARPDAAVRVRGERDYRGVGRYGSSERQRVGAVVNRPGGRVPAYVRVTNHGVAPDRVSVRLRVSSTWFRVTGPCADGDRSPVLAPGESWVCRFSVKRRAETDAGRSASVRVQVRSVALPSRKDAVAIDVRAG